MLKEKLYIILRDVNNMKSRNNAMDRCVKSKLDNSLQKYTIEVEHTCDYLMSRACCKVVKNIAKQIKKEESK